MASMQTLTSRWDFGVALIPAAPCGRARLHLADIPPPFPAAQVLAAFSEKHNFAGQPFLDSLRAYLWSFRLPGESQKIDRMMEVFAKRYCSCNSGFFKDSDTA